MSKFTAPQLKALKSAVDTGNAWNAWGNVYRASTNRMMQTLCAQGLLTHDGRPTDKTADALGVRIAYGSVKVGAAVISAQAETLYETTIPGAPGRVTLGHPLERALEAVAADLCVPVAMVTGSEQIVIPGDIPPGRYLMQVQRDGSDGHTIKLSPQAFASFECALERPATPRPALLALLARRPAWHVSRRPGHRVRRYNTVCLGIDNHKVVDTFRRNALEDLRRLDAQDAYVCAIEVELLQYDRRRRNKRLDRKVAKLRKILRTLKRGIYE